MRPKSRFNTRNKQFNKRQAESVQNMLNERLSNQPPREFQELIRPIFHEDEWILVAIGGILGALVGWGQLVLLFGESLIEDGIPLG